MCYLNFLSGSITNYKIIDWLQEVAWSNGGRA
jgi:hypothetical protein